MARVINRTAVAKSDEGGNFITTSGIYNTHLKCVEVEYKDSGAMFANYFFTNGMSYSNLLKDKSGKDAYGFNQLDSLGIIEDLESYSIAQNELEEYEMVFKNSTKTLMVIPEFTDIDVTVFVQYMYEVYEEQIKERVAVKRFYRPSDNASSTEIVDETPVGVRFASDTEKYASTVIYKETDAEAVAAWKEAQKSGATTPAVNGGAAKAAGFSGGAAARKGFGRPSSNQ